VDEEEIKIKMDDGVSRFFSSFRVCLFFSLFLTSGRRILVSRSQNEIAVQPCLWDPE